jgi:hypothetical protein
LQVPAGPAPARRGEEEAAVIPAASSNHDRSNPFRRVLVGWDASPNSVTALKVAAAVAGSAHGEVVAASTARQRASHHRLMRRWYEGSPGAHQLNRPAVARQGRPGDGWRRSTGDQNGGAQMAGGLFGLGPGEPVPDVGVCFGRLSATGGRRAARVRGSPVHRWRCRRRGKGGAVRWRPRSAGHTGRVTGRAARDRLMPAAPSVYGESRLRDEARVPSRTRARLMASTCCPTRMPD